MDVLFLLFQIPYSTLTYIFWKHSKAENTKQPVPLVGMHLWWKCQKSGWHSCPLFSRRTYIPCHSWPLRFPVSFMYSTPRFSFQGIMPWKYKDLIYSHENDFFHFTLWIPGRSENETPQFTLLDLIKISKTLLLF